MTVATEPTPLAISVRQAAKLLSISHSHAYTLIRRGELPAKKLGERWVVPYAELQTWLANLPDERFTDPSDHIPSPRR